MNNLTGESTSHTLSLYLANRAGVLNRVVLVFSRRGWNIDSLSVSPDPDGQFSCCTIVASGDSNTLHKIVGQLKKLVDVVDAHEVRYEDVVESELAIVRIACPLSKRAELGLSMSKYLCQRVDESESDVTYQVVGTRTTLGEMTDFIVRRFGLREIIRTGSIVMERSTPLEYDISDSEPSGLGGNQAPSFV